MLVTACVLLLLCFFFFLYFCCISPTYQMLGLAEGCFARTVPYTMERKQFGHRIWDFQVCACAAGFRITTGFCFAFSKMSVGL